MKADFIFKRRTVIVSVILTFSGSLTLADELGREAERSGLFPKSLAFEGGVNTTTQFSNQKDLENEVLTSFDLLGSMPTSGGQFNFYIEGNSSPGANGVASRIQGSNADAGTALNRRGEGRIQISEFNFADSDPTSQFAVGLIDPGAFLDVSSIANDEKTQFLSAQLVNNASIALPDYTLAIAYHHEHQPSLPGFTLFVSSSHGLADNEESSYSTLFDVTGKNKGVFSAVEIYQDYSGLIPRLGFWFNNAEQEKNLGAYVTVDGNVHDVNWNARLGWANPTVSEINATASVAMEFSLMRNIVGAGVAYLRASPEVDINYADSIQAETYVRLRLNKQLHMSPVLQYFSRSELNGNISGQDAFVFGLRFGYEV